MRAEVLVTCVFCAVRGKTPDHGRHLHINVLKNVAHCFRCGFGSRDAKTIVEEHQITLPNGVAWGVAGIQAATVRHEAVQLPGAFRTDFYSPEGKPAWNYLLGRGLTPSMIYGYGIGFCVSGPLAQRVVVPIHHQGEVIWWQARDITGTNPKKYWNPPGVSKACLFNLPRALENGLVLLVEGIFDALAVPNYGVALMGKQLSDIQREILLQNPPPVILVGLDRVEHKDTDTIVGQLQRLVPCVDVLTVPPPWKDWGELPEIERDRYTTSLCELANLVRMRVRATG